MVVKYFCTKKGIATFILVIMLTQLLFFEGAEVSIFKVGIMALMPFIYISMVPKITKGIFWGGIYILSVCIVAVLHENVRFSTIVFLSLYVSTAVIFYNFVYANAFDLQYFIKFLKVLILAYAVCLVAQQFFVLMGVRYMPLINLCNQHFLAIDKLPSWSVEPSHSARILTAAMFGYLKCNEFLQGSPVTVRQLCSNRHKWVTIGFLWTMLTMGSGTAFVGLGILPLYFITKKTVLYLAPMLIGIFIILAQLNLTQFNRAMNLAEATLSGDVQTMKKADGSGASRIVPVVNTFTNLDLANSETWIGVGTTTKEYNQSAWQRDDAKLVIIEQYGILCYIISLVLVYVCFIRKFLSIETLIFVVMLGCSIISIYYLWGIFMIFCTIKFFEKKYKTN